MKTLQSLPLLHCLQLDGMIPVIYRFSYTARSFPHSKHYNFPTSMRVIIDNGRCLCMTIPTITVIKKSQRADLAIAKIRINS